MKLHQKFHGGVATNVGGWHIAAAKGLPQRLITSMTVDPNNHRTVYATLGASAARYFSPIGSLGESTAGSGGGYVYKSTDAGKTFTDITGDLPRAQATWSLLRNGQLIVGDALGLFISAGTSGGHYAPMGTTLPAAPVYMMQLKPGDPNTLVAASFGRGGYTYRFPANAVLRPGSNPNPGQVGKPGSGGLAATGLSLVYPVLGLVLLLGAGLLLRRRARGLG